MGKKKSNFKREGRKEKREKMGEAGGSRSRVDRDYLCYHVIAIGQEGVGKRDTRHKTR
jgi:hypothetical protein